MSWKAQHILLYLYYCFRELVPHSVRKMFSVCSVCFLLLVYRTPSVWLCLQDEKAEGFISLPEFRIDRAIECRRKLWVSMALKLIIMHAGSRHILRKPLMSSFPWLQCLQSLSSQNQELLLCHRLSGRDEQVRLSLHYCLWTMVERLGTPRVLQWIFNRVNQVYTRQQPTQHSAWIRHESVLMNAEWCV